jgi:hypothetical protein
MSQLKLLWWPMRKAIIGIAIVVILAEGASWLGLPSKIKGGGDSDSNRARVDIKSLEIAVTLYQQKNGHLPLSLAILAERGEDGSPALVVNHYLIDPWRMPYHYDRTSLHPSNGIPLIWSDGPPGRNRPIRNWD